MMDADEKLYRTKSPPEHKQSIISRSDNMIVWNCHPYDMDSVWFTGEQEWQSEREGGCCIAAHGRKTMIASKEATLESKMYQLACVGPSIVQTRTVSRVDLPNTWTKDVWARPIKIEIQREHVFFRWHNRPFLVSGVEEVYVLCEITDGWQDFKRDVGCISLSCHAVDISATKSANAKTWFSYSFGQYRVWEHNFVRMKPLRCPTKPSFARDYACPPQTIEPQCGKDETIFSWSGAEQCRARDNGPAIITDQSQTWYAFGVKHRFDGPAVIYASGRMEWWKYGKFICAVGDVHSVAKGAKRARLNDGSN